MRVSDGLSSVRSAMMESSERATRRRLTLLKAAPCKPRCSSCCKRLIYVSLAEGIVIYQHLESSGRWPSVRRKAIEALSLVREAHPEPYFRTGTDCPVLDPETLLCLAYPVRPTPCSTHFVASDPDLCDPWTVREGVYEPVDMKDLHEEFRRTLDRAVGDGGVLAVRMPIQAALLLAEKVQYIRADTPEEMETLVRAEFA